MCCTIAAVLYAHAAAETECGASSSGVAFGTYDPTLSTPDDSTGTVIVTCTYESGGGAERVNYVARLSTGSSGSYALRRMRSGTNQLGYNLYLDASRLFVWGNGQNGSSTVSGSMTVGPGNGNRQRQTTHTVYGRMPARQDALDGTYTDTIIVAVEF